MIPFETAFLFIGAAAALAAVPGPDNIFVLMQSARFGPRSGLIVTLGVVSGVVVHTAAAAFGAAVLFQTSALAFTALKWVGAAYLLYLAWGTISASANQIDSGHLPQIAPAKLYLSGLIMNVANPKVTIFMLAFLPQFVDPSAGPLGAQFFQLGGLLFVVTLVVFGGVAMAAGRLGRTLNSSPKIQIWLNRIAGLVFAGLAFKLLTAQR